jgi:hypothetical protein
LNTPGRETGSPFGLPVYQSLNGANLQDEKTIRGLVDQLSQMAGRQVPKQLEDKIVDTLVKKKLTLKRFQRWWGNKK